MRHFYLFKVSNTRCRVTYTGDLTDVSEISSKWTKNLEIDKNLTNMHVYNAKGSGLDKIFKPGIKSTKSKGDLFIKTIESLPLARKGTEKEYCSTFVVQSLGLNGGQFRRFIRHQLANNPRQFELREYLEFDFLNLLQKSGQNAKVRSLKMILNEKPNGILVFENNFNKMAPEEAYKFFKSRLLDEGHINEEQLDSFIISALQDKTPLGKKIETRLSNTKLKNIMKEFKEKANDLRQRNYIDDYVWLISEFFKGRIHDSIKGNWSK